MTTAMQVDGESDGETYYSDLDGYRAPLFPPGERQHTPPAELVRGTLPYIEWIQAEYERLVAARKAWKKRVRGIRRRRREEGIIEPEWEDSDEEAARARNAPPVASPEPIKRPVEVIEIDDSPEIPVAGPSEPKRRKTDTAVVVPPVQQADLPGSKSLPAIATSSRSRKDSGKGKKKVSLEPDHYWLEPELPILDTSGNKIPKATRDQHTLCKRFETLERFLEFYAERTPPEVPGYESQLLKGKRMLVIACARDQKLQSYHNREAKSIQCAWLAGAQLESEYVVGQTTHVVAMHKTGYKNVDLQWSDVVKLLPPSFVEDFDRRRDAHGRPAVHVVTMTWLFQNWKFDSIETDEYECLVQGRPTEQAKSAPAKPFEFTAHGNMPSYHFMGLHPGAGGAAPRPRAQEPMPGTLVSMAPRRQRGVSDSQTSTDHTDSQPVQVTHVTPMNSTKQTLFQQDPLPEETSHDSIEDVTFIPAHPVVVPKAKSTLTFVGREQTIKAEDDFSDLGVHLESARIAAELGMREDGEDSDGEDDSKTIYDLDERSDSGEEEEEYMRTGKRPVKEIIPPKSKAQGWACEKGGELTDKVCPNQDIIDWLNKLAKYHEAQSGSLNHFKVRNYRSAMGALRGLDRRIDIRTPLKHLNGIGDKTEKKIREIIKTGKLRRLDSITEEDKVAGELRKVHGIGASTARDYYRRGIKTVQQLKDPELCAKLGIVHNLNIQLGLEHFDDLQERMPRAEAKAIHDLIEGIGLAIDPNTVFEIMGSYRRGQPDCGDVDILVSRSTQDGRDHRGVIKKLYAQLEADPRCQVKTLTAPEDWRALDASWHGLIRLESHGKWRRLDLLGTPESEIGAALIFAQTHADFTGDDIFNRSLRLKARKVRRMPRRRSRRQMGLSLNQRGVYAGVTRDPKTGLKTTEGTRLELNTERAIFERLGVTWRPPTSRLPGAHR